MRKLLTSLLIIIFNFIISFNNFANASIHPIYIDYVSAKDGDEFIWLYNAGDDFNVESLSIEKITYKDTQLFPIQDKGIFKHGTYKEIRFDKDKIIPNKFNFNLIINGSIFDAVSGLIKDDQIWSKNNKINREEFLNLKLLSSAWASESEDITDNQDGVRDENFTSTTEDSSLKQPDNAISEKSNCPNVFLNEILNPNFLFLKIDPAEYNLHIFLFLSSAASHGRYNIAIRLIFFLFYHHRSVFLYMKNNFFSF